MSETWIKELVAVDLLTTTDPGGNGTYSVFTIPDDEYYEFISIYGGRNGGAGLTVGTLIVKDNNTGVEVYVKKPTTAEDNLYDFASGHLPMKPGDELEVSVSNYAATNTMIFNAYSWRWKRRQ